MLQEYEYKRPQKNTAFDDYKWLLHNYLYDI
jgi:hypothetical protein